MERPRRRKRPPVLLVEHDRPDWEQAVALAAELRRRLTTDPERVWNPRTRLWLVLRRAEGWIGRPRTREGVVVVSDLIDALDEIEPFGLVQTRDGLWLGFTSRIPEEPTHGPVLVPSFPPFGNPAAGRGGPFGKTIELHQKAESLR